MKCYFYMDFLNALLLYNVFDNNWNLRNHVYSGDFIKYCFRPINIFFIICLRYLILKGLGQFVFGSLVLGYAWNNINLVYQ